MNVFIADEQDESVEVEPLRRLALRVLDAERLPEETEVAILLVGDDQMARYNERFMGRHGSTDVLAFPLEQLQPGVVPAPSPSGPPVNLGDVIIAPGVVADQADAAGVPYEDELAHMVVHGLLHLLGYDHQNEEQAEEMEQRERELLSGRIHRR